MEDGNDKPTTHGPARAPVHAAGAPRRVSASDFKNAWHRHLDRVSQAKEELVITRYGEPIARLVPYEEGEPESILGFLDGAVTVVEDIISPLDEEWEADA